MCHLEWCILYSGMTHSGTQNTAFLKISFANSELNRKIKNKKNTGISCEQLTYTGYLFFSKNAMRMSTGSLFWGFWQNVKQSHSASETKFCTGKVPLSSHHLFLIKWYARLWSHQKDRENKKTDNNKSFKDMETLYCS